MAKRARRRFRRRSGRWSPNIEQIVDNFSIGSLGQFGGARTLVTNNTSTSASSISQIFTVKNVEINFNIDLSDAVQIANIEALTAFILYLPQGFTLASLPSDFPQQHPEWIMNYKYIGSPTNEYAGQASAGPNYVGQQYQPIRVKSRLSRKLHTGDRIILFIQGYQQASGGSSSSLQVHGLVRWWTKAN